MKKKTIKIVAWFALLAMLLGIVATIIAPIL
jgi:uncharacterized membrane protein